MVWSGMETSELCPFEDFGGSFYSVVAPLSNGGMNPEEVVLRSQPKKVFLNHINAISR